MRGGLKPFLRWVGGKRWLTARYGDIFPREFNRYIEPFLGSGAVFFYLLPEKAILGDINEDLILTYEALREDWRRVYDLLKVHHGRHSRDYYIRIRRERPEGLFERAAWFLYLNSACFNGLCRYNLRGEFNAPIGKEIKPLPPPEFWEEVSRALQAADLRVSDFEALVDLAGEGDFLFIDPPYALPEKGGFKDYVLKAFGWEDQERLLKALSRALERGAVILGTNVFHEGLVEMYREVFGENLALVERVSSLAAKREGRGRYREFIFWGNLEIPAELRPGVPLEDLPRNCVSLSISEGDFSKDGLQNTFSGAGIGWMATEVAVWWRPYVSEVRHPAEGLVAVIEPVFKKWLRVRDGPFVEDQGFT
ncbi:DNA adenine methylase [Thermosulfurimonas dismutans]|uniref:site-specific DNA-methyltransferase (adenine-specific) n=1 Tax=Thermosulfurimonas dismutans TaxID=999894 RepID=A0A179D661_9BACT|nr:DNA adenine methylase [Thermosulfurimonas dismutans]